MSPRYWALATFLVPVIEVVGYLMWLVVSAAHLASSTQSEELVRTGIYAAIATALAVVQRPWARAIAMASAVTLALWLVGVFEFEMLRHQ
jgi:hypothetical protein